MKRILALGLIGVLIGSNCFGADINDWKRGDASIPVKGTDDVSDIDTDVSNYIVDPLDNVLTEYISGCSITYASAATVTIGVGEVVCYNSAKTVKRMRRNTSTVTITLPASGASGSSLDTGNAAISTWYYVYAVADADATTFTGVCSASASAPTGATYFRRIGKFYNNSSDNITEFTVRGNEGATTLGVWTTTDIDAVALAKATVYLADTDGFAMCYSQSAGGSGDIVGYTDSANPPTTVRARMLIADTFIPYICFPVKAGHYWKIEASNTSSDTIKWIPLVYTNK